VLRGGQAVVLGIRAASRNPELAFGLGLVGLSQWLLSALPLLWGATLILRSSDGIAADEALARLPSQLAALGPALAGAALTGAAIVWALDVAFWTGGLPILAADAELDARPPGGAFWTLLGRGYARVAGASAVASLLGLAISAAMFAGMLWLPAALWGEASVGRWTLAAALVASALAWSLLCDLLGQLLVVRAAVLGDGATAALSAAARLLGERLGALVWVSASIFVLELVVGGAAASLTLFLSSTVDLSAGAQLLALAPRGAVAVAAAVVVAWLETARQGAFAILAADQAGLIDLPEEEQHGGEPGSAWRRAGRGRPEEPRRLRRIPEPWELRPRQPASPPRPSTAADEPGEPVVEALPVDEAAQAEEPVVEALPLPEEAPAASEPAPTAGEPDGAPPEDAPPKREP
jgi:hypothetical protein